MIYYLTPINRHMQVFRVIRILENDFREAIATFASETNDHRFHNFKN